MLMNVKMELITVTVFMLYVLIILAALHALVQVDLVEMELTKVWVELVVKVHHIPITSMLKVNGCCI